MNYGKFKSCLNIGCLIFCCSVFFTIQGCIKESKIAEDHGREPVVECQG